MPPCGPLALSISPDLDRAIFYNFTNNFIDKLEVEIELVPGRRSILLSQERIIFGKFPNSPGERGLVGPVGLEPTTRPL